ncbi:unnamed protein product [Chrysodeixis includens]|uniref:unspecific monooxygenase n=1 Tax=Chrysodeixis includens TaxID=689277 RepID=A0A9N8L0K6_CHRIL|nr:unnamed protein product [Chrysodeixis includens]
MIDMTAIDLHLNYITYLLVSARQTNNLWSAPSLARLCCNSSHLFAADTTMILEILIFLVTTIVGYYLWSYKQLHKYFEERGIKYVPGIPLFGNSFKSTFVKRHIFYDLMDVYTAYPDEKYVGYLELTVPILMIRDPELIKNITIKDFDHFTDHREFFTEDSDPLFAGSLFLMKGEKWREMRNTLSPAFTGSKMKLMLPSMIENSHNVLEYLNEHQSEEIDVDDLTHRYTNDVIASAGFGLQVNSFKNKNNEFFGIGSTIFEFDFKQRIFMMLNAQFPSLAKKLGTRLFPDKTYNFFRNIVTSTMEYRKKEKVTRPDMIQLLMETPKEWTADEIIGQVFLFFAGGFETTASAIAMTIHELAINPDVEEKLYQEIRNFNEKTELTFENLNELKYLDCVVNETMRKWCPAILMDRICSKTYVLPPPREGGKPCVLNPGDILHNMVNCLQMDPKYYPNPDVYDPERFSDENKHKIQPFTYMPFGSGPRICIGLRLALMEVKVFLYQVLLKYKIVKSERTTDPITLKPHNFNIRAANGTFVRFEKRK